MLGGEFFDYFLTLLWCIEKEIVESFLIFIYDILKVWDISHTKQENA